MSLVATANFDRGSCKAGLSKTHGVCVHCQGSWSMTRLAWTREQEEQLRHSQDRQSGQAVAQASKERSGAGTETEITRQPDTQTTIVPDSQR